MIKEFARTEARGLVSSIHMTAHKPFETPAPGQPMPSPGLCRNCIHTIPLTHTQANTPTYKIKIKIKFKERVSQG